MVLQPPPPLTVLDKGLRASSLDDPVLSPRTPPPSRGVPWSPTPAQQETPQASWADVAKVNSIRPDDGKFRTPTSCQAQFSGTPQPCVPWSYIASPSMEMDDDPRSPGAQTPRRDPTSPLQPARPLLECSTPAKTGTGAAFDWAAHFQLAPQGMFPFDMGATAFPWQAQDAPAAPRWSSPPARCSSPLAASPRTPGASPFRLRSQLTSPPPVGLSGPQRRRSPSPGVPSGSPLRELMETDDPNLGRFRRDFCDISPIARGQFSTVYKAQHKTDRHLYALKVQTTSAPGDRRAPAREVFALAAVATAGVHCENLVRYFSSWQEDDRMHIQIELCESTLRHHLQRRVIERPLDPHFGEEDLVTVLRQAANGLATLHGLGFVHLDVKPDNILFGRDGCYKLGDLGLAISTATGGGPVTEGDCRYLAREVLQGAFKDLTKADVFSLGLVCYELAINPKELPQNGDDWQSLRDGCIDAALLSHLPEDLVRLLRRMVHKMESERPRCLELAEHPGHGLAGELEALRRELREAREAACRNQEMAERYRRELLAVQQKMEFGIASLGG